MQHTLIIKSYFKSLSWSLTLVLTFHGCAQDVRVC